jgi:streptogramin lyase
MMQMPTKESAPRARRSFWAASLVASFFVSSATPARAQGHLYTFDADFDQGALSNVNHAAVHDQLQLDESTTSFPFLWIANTTRGTLVRVDANSGQILGEYKTAPDAHARGPSRLAIDRFGNVWCGNRSETSGGKGSVVKMGLVIGGTRGRKNPDGSFSVDPVGGYLRPPFTYCTAVDRDHDGLIRTSRGLGDILGWPEATDGNGGVTGVVEDAIDECALVYQRTSGPNVNHVSIDAAGVVWVGGYPNAPSMFDKLDAATGQILGSIEPACGGYGGFIDSHGVLWSASFNQGRLHRYDIATNSPSCIAVAQSSGLAADSHGNIWNAMNTTNQIAKLDASGTMLAGFPKASGGGGSFGVAVTLADDNVWIGNSGTATITRLAPDGTLRKRITVGTSPNGVAVDTNGKIWLTSQSVSTLTRINPNGGTDGLGAVDLTVSLGTNAGPLNFGNMATVVNVHAFAVQGTWNVVYDGARSGVRWNSISWHAEEPAGTHVALAARAADAQASLASQAWVVVGNGADLHPSGLAGQYIEMRATLSHDAGVDATPSLLDLAIEANQAPDCAQAHPSVEELWPPDSRMVDVTILGLTDPDGDDVTYTVTGITQDEPVLRGARDPLAHDAVGVGTATASLRSERHGRPGNGRVYEISFVASDGHGGECEGRVTVCVPHDMGQGRHCIDDGRLFDSTNGRSLMGANPLAMRLSPNPFNPSTTVGYVLQQDAPVRLRIFDTAGRLVRSLFTGSQPAGAHTVAWDGRNDSGNTVASGAYLCQVEAGVLTETKRMLLVK